MRLEAIRADRYFGEGFWREKLIAGFAKAAGVPVTDLHERVESGNLQCWACMEGNDVHAMMVTEIIADKWNTCHMMFAGGKNPKAWAGLVSGVEKWACEYGAKRFMLTARPGYKRLLARHGFTLTHLVLEKELPDGRLDGITDTISGPVGAD